MASFGRPACGSRALEILRKLFKLPSVSIKLSQEECSDYGNKGLPGIPSTRHARSSLLERSHDRAHTICGPQSVYCGGLGHPARHSTLGLESRLLHEPLPVHMSIHTSPKVECRAAGPVSDLPGFAF